MVLLGTKPVLHDPPAPVEVPSGRRGVRAVELEGVRITNPDRVLYPEDGVTKLELAEYFLRIADWILPHVIGRPISMVRCPEGIAPAQGEVYEDQGGLCFFHKHGKEQFRGPFEHLVIEEAKGPADYLSPSGPASLVALAQMSVLEIHIWGSHASRLEYPDYVVFDLDPGDDTDWDDVVRGALLVRDVLDALGLRSFAKTTGGKGLHVCVPLLPTEDWATVRAFANAVAAGIADYAPDKYTSAMPKDRRAGRIFVDYLRNSRSNTSIAPYSARARPHATVSMPIAWEEVADGVPSDRFTMRNAPERLAKLKRDPWEDFLSAEQTISENNKRELGIQTTPPVA